MRETCITVKKLRKMLEKWPDDAMIDIYLTEKKITDKNILTPMRAVSGKITSVDFLVDRDEGGPYITMFGVITAVDDPYSEED